MKVILTALILLIALVPKQLSFESYGPTDLYTGPGMLVERLARIYDKPIDYMARVVREVYIQTEKLNFPDPIAVLAIIATESEFRHKAEHPIGPSRGLMQVNVGVHKIGDAFDITQNIAKGVEILKGYRTMTRSESKSYLYYNAGPGGGAKICEESCVTPYVQKVTALKKRFTNFAAMERLQCSKYSFS